MAAKSARKNVIEDNHFRIMRSSIWVPVTIVIGLLFTLVIVCITVFQIKKLEFAHLAKMEDKNLAREILKGKKIDIASSNRSITLKTTFKNILIEICPAFLMKIFGF